jgi:flagellar basal-body rod protein FlgC
MVSGVSNIALSGLQAASKRLDNSANNVANQLTVSTDSKPAFQPQDIVQISDAAGGVRTLTAPRNPATVAVPSAESESGVVQAPNVDQAEELVNQKFAVNDFQANLAVLRAQDKQQESLLDIIA